MTQMDETIHQPVRLKIMAALKALPKNEQIVFVRLREIVDATEGNLGANIATLEKNPVISRWSKISTVRSHVPGLHDHGGRRAFQQYVDHLRSILDGNA
jgi:Winged helix DNA-binding domain